MYVRPYVNDILEEKGPIYIYIYIVILVNTEWRFNIWFKIKNMWDLLQPFMTKNIYVRVKLYIRAMKTFRWRGVEI